LYEKLELEVGLVRVEQIEKELDGLSWNWIEKKRQKIESHPILSSLLEFSIFHAMESINSCFLFVPGSMRTKISGVKAFLIGVRFNVEAEKPRYSISTSTP
jgi:hypothetical protein